MEKSFIVGIIRPISALEHSAEGYTHTRKIIAETPPEDDFLRPRIVSDESGRDIPKRIIDCITSSDVVVIDMTDKNPNTMLELGTRAAFGLPLILVMLRGQPYLTDFQIQDTIAVPKDSDHDKIMEFEHILLSAVHDEIDHDSESPNTNFIS